MKKQELKSKKKKSWIYKFHFTFSIVEKKYVFKSLKDKPGKKNEQNFMEKGTKFIKILKCITLFIKKKNHKIFVTLKPKIIIYSMLYSVLFWNTNGLSCITLHTEFICPQGSQVCFWQKKLNYIYEDFKLI